MAETKTKKKTTSKKAATAKSKKAAPKGTASPKPKQPAAKKNAGPESFQFQAETRQLLDIVINSLYSNKEIFLRELISNASDATDRLRFEALTQPDVLGKDEKLEIRLETNKEARTLTISDNGSGMSREEVIENIGTIAKSGTRELVNKLKEGQAGEAESGNSLAQLIGQFGVGFYSAFMVADRVVLITRRAGDTAATRWESTGDGSYTIVDDHRFHRGTSIILHLKAIDKENGIEDFSDQHVLERIVKQYSDFVAYPVTMQIERQEAEKDQQGKDTEVMQTIIEDKVLNSMKPIWTRPAAEVTEEEYSQFYKHISHDWNDPLDKLSLRAEGRIEYQALLFLPKKAPWDLYYREQKRGLQLYVRRVLILDHCEELMPVYLRFVKGVVDSADLPLNLSREMVQQDRHINQMSKWLVRKVLDHLKKMLADDREKFLELWNEYGQVLKEGINSDFDNRERVQGLLLFQSSHDETKLTTLAEYVERMGDEQDDIYYLTGENRSLVETSPHLEAFKEKGTEVLYLVDPIDEFMISSVTDYEEHKLKSVAKGDVELGSKEERKEAKEKLEEKKENFSDFMKFLQKSLDEHVSEVRLSQRLKTSPVCLVSGEHDMSPVYERFMRQNEGTGAMPKQKRILEINPEHDLVGKLRARFDKDEKDSLLGDYAQMIYGYALLAEGSELPDPAAYNRIVGKMMLRGL
jgi:molecular chaperone HtpG